MKPCEICGEPTLRDLDICSCCNYQRIESSVAYKPTFPDLNIKDIEKFSIPNWIKLQNKTPRNTPL